MANEYRTFGVKIPSLSILAKVRACLFGCTWKKVEASGSLLEFLLTTPKLGGLVHFINFAFVVREVSVSIRQPLVRKPALQKCRIQEMRN